jgi:Dolichyl-phosphate-mannose-protein mannosyltransferase
MRTAVVEPTSTRRADRPIRASGRSGGLRRPPRSVRAAAPAALIGSAVVIRLALILGGWPQTNSDEATMGLAALHIFHGRALPTYFYGQDYMGTLEAYLGALSFHVLGPSTVALRLGVVALVAVTFVLIHRLGVALYDRRVALVGLALLALGSPAILTAETAALGGRPEGMLCAAACLLVSVRLVIAGPSMSTRRRRAAFLVWGLAAGIGVWSDLLVLPWLVAAAGLLSIPALGGPWRRRGLPWLVGGLVLGAMPMIVHDASTGHASLAAVVHVATSGGSAPLVDRLRGTFLIGLPLWSGATDVCGAFARPQCTAGASLLLVGVWVVAAAQAVRAFARARRRVPTGHAFGAHRVELGRRAGRLALVGAAALTLATYALSSAPAVFPTTSIRYLVPLVIGTPAMVAPLVEASRRRLARGTVLGLAVGVLAVGVLHGFRDAVGARSQERDRVVLAHDLLRRGITRIRTDYWTCDRIAFQTRERIVCAVVDDGLGVGYERYPPYRPMVDADPRAAYVLPVGSPAAETLRRSLDRTGLEDAVEVTTAEGYLIVRPVTTSAQATFATIAASRTSSPSSSSASSIVSGGSSLSTLP